MNNVSLPMKGLLACQRLWKFGGILLVVISLLMIRTSLQGLSQNQRLATQDETIFTIPASSIEINMNNNNNNSIENINPTEASTTQQRAPSTFNEAVKTQQEQEVHRILFPITMKNFVSGMTRVSRKDFMSKFDIGYGIDPETAGNSEVLLLHISSDALPSNYTVADQRNQIVPFADLEEAMENCRVVKVVVTDPKPDQGRRRIKSISSVLRLSETGSRHIFISLPNQGRNICIERRIIAMRYLQRMKQR